MPPPVEVGGVERQAKPAGADAVEKPVQELRVISNLAVVFDAVANGRVLRQGAETFASVDRKGKELVSLQFARHDINPDDLDAELLGGRNQPARTLKLLLQALVKAVAHHKRRDTATAGRKVILERSNAFRRGQRVLALRVKQQGAGQVQLDADLDRFRAHRFHAGPAIRQAGHLQMHVATANQCFLFSGGQQRAGGGEHPGRQGQAGSFDKTAS